MNNDNGHGFKQNNDAKQYGKCCSAYSNIATQIPQVSGNGILGVFEEELSAQQDGNIGNGSPNSEEQISKKLISIAQKHNLFIPKDNWNNFGERKRLSSGESIVYFNEKENCVVKIKNPFAKKHLKNLNSENVLYEHIVHNLLFPYSKYELIGISEDDGSVRMVLKQSFIYEYTLPKQKQIEKYLFNLGLTKEDKYFYGNDFVAVTDVDATSDNVLVNMQGDLFFIDPIIKIKQPIKETLEFLIANSQTENRNSKQNIFKRLIRYINR